MSNRRTPSLLPVLAFLLPIACDGDGIPGGKPQTSYCEALCDWAVLCASAEREVDQASLLDRCLEAARANDPSCAEAESKNGLDAASAAALQECTDAIEEAATAGECDAFTGRIDEQQTATAPAECASQEDAQQTFDEVQESTAETSDELCERFTDSYCDRLQDCLLGALGVTEIPQDLIDAAGGTPAELCEAQIAPITDSCKAEDRYAPEESVTDVNTARQAARTCLADLTSLPCSDLLAGEIPASCAGSFTSTDDATAFAQALIDVAGAFLD
jgi:hypothetical protein